MPTNQARETLQQKICGYGCADILDKACSATAYAPYQQHKLRSII